MTAALSLWRPYYPLLEAPVTIAVRGRYTANQQEEKILSKKTCSLNKTTSTDWLSKRFFPWVPCSFRYESPLLCFLGFEGSVFTMELQKYSLAEIAALYSTCQKAALSIFAAHCDLHTHLPLTTQMSSFLLTPRGIEFRWRDLSMATPKIDGHLGFQLCAFPLCLFVYNRQLRINLVRWSLFHHTLRFRINTHRDPQ